MKLPRVKLNTAKNLALLWLVAWMPLMSFFFTNVLRQHNYLEIFPGELIFPALMHAVTALLIALTVYFIPRPRQLAAKMVAALLLSLLLVGYDGNLIALSGVLRAFMPGAPAEQAIELISLVYLALLVGLAMGAGLLYERIQHRRQLTSHRNVQGGILILAGWLFASQALGVARVLPSMIRQNRASTPVLPKPQADAAADRPDIYYIVLDDYTNDAVLKDQFGFDNSAFSDFLRQSGFTVNADAYSEYPYTAMSVAATLNANYTKDTLAPYLKDPIESKTLYHRLIYQSSVIRALKDSGYQYLHIGSTYGVSYNAPQADINLIGAEDLSVFGYHKHLNGIETSSFQQTPYYRLALSGWWPLRLTELDPVNYIRGQLNSLDAVATSKQQGGRFVFAHILVPHGNYYFNADGSISPNSGEDANGETLKTKYVRQVQFINNQITPIIQDIQRTSGGQAVIILNSDEGAHAQLMDADFRHPAQGSDDEGENHNDVASWPTDWLQMKLGIQQAIYLPKATPDDLSHLSSINLFRIVLNRYLGYQLDYLPQCLFGVTDGTVSEFRYKDVTDRLRPGSDSSYCQDQATVK